jgi:hypothetical protein
MRTVYKTYWTRVPADYDGSVVTSLPVVDSSAVVTAGATKPIKPEKGPAQEIESKKPEAEVADLPAPAGKSSSETKGGLEIGPPSGDKSNKDSVSNKVPAAGKIQPQNDD